MLSDYIDKVLAYPKMVLLLIALGTFIAFGGLTKVDVNSKFTSDLPQDDPLVISNNTINEVFGESSLAWIGIESDNVFQKRTLEKVKAISFSDDLNT